MGAGSSSRARCPPPSFTSLPSSTPSSALPSPGPGPYLVVGRSAGHTQRLVPLQPEDGILQASRSDLRAEPQQQEAPSMKKTPTVDNGMPDEDENQNYTVGTAQQEIHQDIVERDDTGIKEDDSGGNIWEWVAGEEEEEEKEEKEWDEAQELVGAIRAAARQAGGGLKDALYNASKGGKISCEEFCSALLGWDGLSGKLGLVERAGMHVFEALSKGQTKASVQEAHDFLSVNSRGNPLRAATALRGTNGGKIKEMERAQAEATVEVEKMRAAREFLYAESYATAVREMQISEQIKGVTASIAKKEGEEALRAEAQLASLKRQLVKVQAAAREAKQRAEDNERRLLGAVRWREHLELELEEERAFAAYREVGLRQLEHILRSKEAERDSLRESAWLKGSANPERWAEAPSEAAVAKVKEGQDEQGGEQTGGEQGGEQTGGDGLQRDLNDADTHKVEDDQQGDATEDDKDEQGDDNQRDGPTLLHEIHARRCEVAAMHMLLLPHSIHAFRRIEAQHSAAGGKLHELEDKVEQLSNVEEGRREAQAHLRRARDEIKVLESEVVGLRERVERLEMEKRALVDERDRARESHAEADKAAKEAEGRMREATERLAHAEGLMTSMHNESVTLRTEAFSAVLVAKEARELVNELEALRQKEERKWLEVQEDETKKQSKMLSIRVNDFQANRLGKPPSGPRVFLSSSISDFRKEREEIKTFAMPALQAACARRGMLLTLVDLRYGLGDGDVTVGRMMPMVLREMEQCNYFTCFLGQQTGAFPLNYTKDAAGTGKRTQARPAYAEFCTEMEANYILERRLQWGGRAFFYVRDGRSVDDVTATVDVAVTDSMSEAMLALKQRVYASGLKVVVDYMSARDGVYAWRDDVLMVLEKDYPLDKDEVSHVPVGVDGWRPRAFLECLEDKGHDAAFETRLAAYVRNSATERVMSAIREHVEKQGGSPLLITGPPGCGKATAMAVFLAQYRQEVLAHDEHALIQGISTRSVHTTPVNLLRTMMRMVKTHFRIDNPGLPDAESEVLSHGALFSWLEMGGLEGTVVFCMDLDGFQAEYHTLPATRQQQAKGDGAQDAGAEGGTGGWLGGDGTDMKWLTAAQPSGANLIVSASHPAAVRTARETYFWPIVEMQEMSREESENMVQQFLGSRGLMLDARRKQQLWSLRQDEMGSPLFLKVLLTEWAMLDTVGWRHDVHIDRILVIRSKDISKSVSLLFKLLLDRWEEELEESSVAVFGPCLSNIVLSRAGLSEEELLGITGLKPSHVGVFLSTCRSLLSSKSGTYTVASHVLVQAIAQRYMQGTVEVQGGRAALIEYFRSKGFGDDRTCFELPYQLHLAAQLPELESTIKVLGVFRCYLSSGLDSELLAYWKLFTSEAKDIATVYQKALVRLEKEAAEGMSASEQLRIYGVSLEGLSVMADLLSQLGRFLARTGQNLACIQALERLVQVQQKLNPDSSHVASAAMRVATQCWRIAYFEQGLPHVQMCLALQERLHGRDSMQVSEASQLLAMTLFGLNRLDEAEKAMYTSLKLREQNVGKDHPSVAEALLHMGKIILRLGRTEEARDLQLRANKLMGARTRKSIRQFRETDEQQQQSN